MGLQEAVAALIVEEKAQEESYRHHIIIEDMIWNMVSYCEDKLINGSTNEIKGLLNVCGDISTTRKCDQTRKEFYFRALETYVRNAGRTPTHIVLPFKEILQLHMERQGSASICIGETAQGFSNKLFGIPIIVSDALSGEHGLILTVNDIVLASSPGLKWKFVREYGTLKCGKVAIILHFAMGLLVKRPEAIAKLTLKKTEGGGGT